MPHLIVVRRNQARAYETLKTEFEHDPNTGVRVVWDRRRGERREAIEEVDIDRERRRHRERRGPVPAIWQSLGVLVVAVEV
jgi:hypothetical protein